MISIGSSPTLVLVAPTVAHAADYLAMVDEAIAAGEGYPYNDIELARADFAAFVRELAEEAAGIGLPPEIAPQETWLLVTGGGWVVGEFRFRPTLWPPFEAQNGHIGYNIRPSARRQGYATRGLALLLRRAAAAGLGGVSLTVAGANPASVRVIERNGGRLTHTLSNEQGEQIGCYWIALGDGGGGLEAGDR